MMTKRTSAIIKNGLAKSRQMKSSYSIRSGGNATVSLLYMEYSPQIGTNGLKS